MTTSFNFKASLIVATLLALPVAQAATMAKADYTADKTRISAEYKADKATCDALKDNAKDVCAEEAKGKEKVALAELEYAYTGKAKDRTKALETKVKADYAVAKEKCDDQTGNAKDVCVKEAKAVETKALADVKMNKEIKEAKKDDTVAKSDADYKVAIEKCDALAGDPKATCIAAAKSKFGKN
jgi:uncharacterized protein with LGFP repeats